MEIHKSMSKIKAAVPEQEVTYRVNDGRKFNSQRPNSENRSSN